MFRLLFIACICIQSDSAQIDVGVFAKALWFLHAYGNVECSSARNDLLIKQRLATALAQDRDLTLKSIDGLIQPEVFQRLAGGDQRITFSELSAALDSSVPSARERLLPELRDHAAWLSTTYDMIEPDKYGPMEQLSNWIADNWQADTSLHVIVTCTGNSRRSILSATMGNVAAAYYGLDNIRFHSGGTTPSAFNPRTVSALRAIGFQIELTGEEGPRGDVQLPNPIYRVQWGEGLEALEFSKHYKDESNPQSDFAAVLVCAEADDDCPIIEGATLRIGMRFLDPKVYDDGRFESRKYAERRDDIGRTFLAVMAYASRKIQEKEPAASHVR